MTSEAWWEVVDKNYDDLCAIVDGYHPARNLTHSLPITAIAAEAACEGIRKQIRAEQGNDIDSPLRKFMRAVYSREEITVSTLLSQTYFGVPESTSCWSIPGFSILVDLLDDPMEDLD